MTDESRGSDADDVNALQAALAEERAQVAELRASQARLLTVLAHAPDFVLELERSTKHGVHAILAKPYEATELLDALSSTIGAR